MPVLLVIPARLGSTRLPRKPLQPLGGVPLIIRVAERIRSHGAADHIVVASDAEEVCAVVERAGFEAVLTAASHPSGTDRVHEVAGRPEYARYDEILNLQGDEPFVSAAAVTGALDRLRAGFAIGTVAAPLEPALVESTSRVKLVMDRSGRALYFSRSPIPFRRDPEADGAPLYWQHLGIYAYTRAALHRLATTAPTPLEQAEGLEQLRALELGIAIGVTLLTEAPAPAVDTWDDLRAAEAFWTVTHEVTS